ncbi:hypothetical protein GCM10022415_03100 [Knoellia locipacati]|uniref:Glycosyltransferase RgtA/B/C/D-like domain-containing protein n=1 Tax=Knoellia locipacati TaxID=882824 RepID=A0A512SWC7_9MICO|nr:hypothetical protein [Knoellia locipacati]GEQ12262.1 hypothetical protein KLO01_03090 [Knoellia locipacati]
MKARWDWGVLAAWITGLVIIRASRLVERDPYWQARDGSERWAGMPLSRADAWSWAQPSGTFRPTSPAWNTALGLGYDALGFAGIAVVGAVGLLAYFVVALVLARWLGSRPLPALVATAGVALLALPLLSPRATTAVEALLLTTIALGYALLVRPLRTGWRLVAVVALGGLALGWGGAWLHVSWSVTAVGLAVALPLAALLAGAPRWRLTLTAVAGLGIALGSTFGPYGWSVWQLLTEISAASDGQVVEWMSPLADGPRTRWLPIAIAVLTLALACVLRVARQRPGAPGSRERARWALEVILLGGSLAAALAGFVAIRFLGVAALTLLPVLAAEISVSTAKWRANPDRSGALRSRLEAAYWRPILTGAIVILLPVALVASHDPGRPDPEAEIMADLPHGCRLFATADAAGVTLLLRTDVKVWIDMRTEVYGADAIAESTRRLGDLSDVALPEGTTCAILPRDTKGVRSDGSPQVWNQLRPVGPMAVWLPGAGA